MKVFFLECSENSTIKSTVVHDDDGATDDDVTNDDDEANAGDAGGADKDRVGGTGGGDDASRAGRDNVFFLTRQSNRPSLATMTARRTTT